MKSEEIYTSGEYLKKWPTWHVEESPWKAKRIMSMILRNNLKPATICEVGCGAGEILKQMQHDMDDACRFWGYEISPQAFEACQSRANERLDFKLADFAEEKDVFFDLILLIDVIEHIEDYFTFLRAIKAKSTYKILHIPLDLAAKTIMQGSLASHRKSHGHIHFFTRDVALQMLTDLGYTVLDSFYTSTTLDFPAHTSKEETRRKMMNVPRKILFSINKDLSARTLGGYSLMVLVQ